MSKRMKKALVKKMEELEMTKKAKLQIDRYRRQYKIMEGSRLAYKEELSNQLDKYRGQLEQLLLEKNNLDIGGNFNSSSSSNLCKEKQYNRVVHQFKRKVSLKEELKKTRTQLLNLSSQIVTHEASVDHMRLKRIDKQAKQEAMKDLGSRIAYFESQLSMETVGLNKLMTKNRHMREEMESLLRERGRFKCQLDQLLSRLSAGKAFIHDLMELGTVAYEQREEAQKKLQLLRRKKTLLEEKHGEAMRDLERELENNIRSTQFMRNKGQERGGRTARLLEDQMRRQVVHSQLSSLDIHFRQILSYFPHLTDPQAIADQYLVQEDENFAIFNYVNEVNCEVENLQAVVEQCKKKLIIEEERKQNEEKQKKPDITVLKENLLTLIKIKEELLEKQNKSKCKRLEIIAEFTEIYKKMRNQPSPYETLIGDDEGSLNAECSLKLLKKKVDELLGKGNFRLKLTESKNIGMK